MSSSISIESLGTHLSLGPTRREARTHTHGQGQWDKLLLFSVCLIHKTEVHTPASTIMLVPWYMYHIW